ncbi:unnamed protein product [Closterium sp. NIES-65]|nr:unnamed protein product [Closterium sp. NIES-65]
MDDAPVVRLSRSSRCKAVRPSIHGASLELAASAYPSEFPLSIHLSRAQAVGDGDIDSYLRGSARNEGDFAAVAVPGAEEHEGRKLQKQVACGKDSIRFTNRLVSDNMNGSATYQLFIKNTCPEDVIGSDGDIDRYGSGIANSEAESTAVAVPGAEEHVRRSLQRQQVTCEQNSILVTNRVVSDQGKGTTKVIQLIIKNLCPYDVIGRDFLCYEANDVHVLRDSEALKVALECLKEAGSVTAWGSYPNVARRTASVRELTQVGIKNAEKLAVPSVRNDALFLATVVGTTSILALAGTQLPGDWGFFVPYLVGGISIVVLAVGSVAPGLLQGGIGAMAPVFSDYKDRVLRHEAGHFLLAYLLGLPPVAYSLDIGKEHTNLLDDKLQKKIYSGKLESDDVDRLAVVAMAGMAAEGLQYEQVMGQTADLNSLQRLINRSGLGALTPERQQNLTRWAVLYAASLIKNNSKSFDALMEAMAREAPVEECIAAIENAAAK